MSPRAPARDGPGSPRQVAGSVAVLALGDLLNKAARFAAVVVLTHVLPLDEYGRLNLGVALGGIAIVVMRLGMPDLGAREVAIAVERREELAARIVTPQAVGMLLVIGLACIVVAVVAPGATPFVLLSGVSTLGLALSGDWLLRGMEQVVPLAVATALGGLVVLGSSLVVSVTTHDALAGLAALGSGELAAAAWTWRSARLRSLPRPTLRGLGSLLRQSWPLAITGAVTYAYYANIDTILIAATHGTRDAGLYSAPYRLFLALNTTGVFAAYALLPLAARAVTLRAAHAMENLTLSCLPPLAGIGLLWLGLAELIGRPLLETAFGTPFGAMATTFIVLCAGVPWYAIGYPVGYSAIASGHPRRLLAGASVAAGLNIALNVALIPPLGPPGAAIATMVAMAAASLTWLACQQLLPRVVPLAAVLALSSAGAGVACLAGGLRDGIGVATLVAAAALFGLGGGGGIRTLRAVR